MSESGGYTGRSLEFLESHGVEVGDLVRITADMVYSGRVMPRYEGAGQDTLVLKLASGYNVGIGMGGITALERTRHDPAPAKSQPAKIPPARQGLPKILLLSTGGTIASTIDYRTGAVTPAMTPGELGASVPELLDIAEIIPKVLFSEHSENLQPEHWERIARELDGISASDYTGVMLAHGTDTMQYTASYLSFALAGFPIPVALVGSQRSPDRPSSDAALNLAGAARFLAGAGARGIYITMHHNGSDREVACHLATRARKNHTSRRGAFETVGGDPAFLVADGQIKQNMRGSFFRTAEYAPRICLDSRVALVKYHPGYDPAMLDHIIDAGYRGVIFEGTGLGHIGRTMYEPVRRAAARGMFLGMTSQCMDGRVRMTVYESGRDLLNLGITPLGNMIPETALVKAMWALGASGNIGEVRQMMLANMASELD